MRHLIALLLVCGTAWAETTITLTADQVADVIEQNTTPVPDPPDPPAPDPPPQECDQVQLAGSVVGWQSVFSEPFPYPVYRNRTYLTVQRDGYLAVQFRTGDVIDDGKLSVLENPQTPGIRTGAISQCAGDFNVESVCRRSWGLGGGIRWATNARPGACQLSPRTVYFFNITFTNGTDPTSSNCVGSPCWVNLQHVNLN